MGLIRFLLASAVILGHAPAWNFSSPGSLIWPTRFIAPYYSVQAFFVISGFYMALVLSEKYRKSPHWLRAFYGNRYLRLAPPFWTVAAASLILAIAIPNPEFPLSKDFAMGWPFTDGGNPLGDAVLVGTNISMFGHDAVEFLSFDGSPGSSYLAIPQAWSIGTELWFYLLAPALILLRSRWLLVLGACSCGLRLVIAASTLPFYPWQQRLFPMELLFFIVGVLGYRLLRTHRVPSQSACLAGLSVLVVACMFSGWLPFLDPPNALGSLTVAAIFGICTPLAFSISKRSRVDSALGELSYPMYLVHVVVGFYFPFQQAHLPSVVLLALSILIALPIIYLVVLPFNVVRERRTRTLLTRVASPLRAGVAQGAPAVG